MEKEYRIKKNQDIELILKEKKSVGNKNYIIYKRKSEAFHFRLAMSVSKKIGNAVVRNRQKRLIKQVFLEEKKNILPYDLFVVARINCTNLEYNEVKREIIYLLKKLNVMKLEER